MPISRYFSNLQVLDQLNKGGIEYRPNVTTVNAKLLQSWHQEFEIE